MQTSPGITLDHFALLPPTAPIYFAHPSQAAAARLALGGSVQVVETRRLPEWPTEVSDNIPTTFEKL